MQIRKSFEANLPFFVETMLSLHKGATVDVYYQVETGTVAVGAPAGGVKVVTVIGVDDGDLESNYGLQRKGDQYEYDDGYSVQVVTRAQLPAFLAQRIDEWSKDGGAEWGWEFTFHWDDVEVQATVELQRKEAERAQQAERAAREANQANARAAAMQAMGQFREALRGGLPDRDALKREVERLAHALPPEGREPGLGTNL